MEHILDQTFFNWVLGLSSVGLGFIINALWTAVKDLQQEDKEIAEKVSSIEVLVAGDYAKKTEVSALASALFTKLDRIEDKLDRKADRGRGE